MAERNLIYFVADVHLGLRLRDPEEREARFITFLKGLPVQSMRALYLLGDIWDFWYEYRDVVPRSSARVVAQFIRLMDEGVEIWFCPGNHDIWTYSYFEELGMHRFEQPFHVRLDGKDFCLGHGDLLGGAPFGYTLMLKTFRCRPIQRIFSTLHPWLAFRFGLGWSNSSRRQHTGYRFPGEKAPLYRFALEESEKQHVDYFVFGHYHNHADMTLPSGARFCILKDWLDGGMPCAVFNGVSFELHSPASPAE